MKLNVLERRKNELRVELVGEGHTFCNALQSKLLKDEKIEYTGYNIPHPLISHPIFFIRTKGERDPVEALVDAAKKLKQELEEIEESFREAWKDEKHQSHGRSKG